MFSFSAFLNYMLVDLLLHNQELSSHVLQNNMEDRKDVHVVCVIWRGKTFIVEMNPFATLRDLGNKLQNLTYVKGDTMRFIVPQSLNQSSKLFTPFSYEHERLNLEETSIIDVSTQAYISK